ncbi:MAG: alanine/glycine:cation symporter family protein, partial [Coriobacteriales bacterium]
WMYTYLLVFLLVFCAIYFSIRTRFVQFRLIKDMFTQLTEKKHVSGKKSLSSFQALMVSTASRVGTGNIAGVAVAIAAGGPGAVFWMWVMACLGAASAFVESTLAQIWKVRGKEGEFRGGPAYYIEKALGKRGLGILFAILLILCYAYGFNGLQAYNMTSALQYYFSDSDAQMAAMAIGIITAVFFAFTIFGGSKVISNITSIIVPVMAITYIGLALFVILTNLNLMGAVFWFISTYAFDLTSILGGFAGSVFVIGIKRGLYSNEAGMGSAPNAAATASVSHPVKQGLVQSLSVYIDTILICTCSALMIMVFYVKVGGNIGELTGMELVQAAVQNEVGIGGIHFISFAICAFAFSSLLGNYFYAEGNIMFITHSKTVLNIFRVTCVIAVWLGCLSSFDLAWNLADITMGFMAIENLIVILILGKWAFKALRDYEVQRKAGTDPVFVAEHIEGLPATDCWHTERNKLDSIGAEPVMDYINEALE